MNIPCPGLIRSQLLHRVQPENMERIDFYGLADCGAFCLPPASIAGSQWCPACWPEGSMVGVAVTARRLLLGLRNGGDDVEVGPTPCIPMQPAASMPVRRVDRDLIDFIR